jgi:hypothetical protein
MDLLNHLETTLPVAQWQVDGVRVWPLVRERLWWSYNTDYASTRTRARAESPLRRRATRAAHVGRDMGSWGAARMLDRTRHAPLRQRADAVLLGDNVSRIPLDGRWYDRLCEPFMECLADLGLRSLHLEPHHLYRRPRSADSHPIQPYLDALWVRARLDRSSQAVELPGHSQLIEQLRRVELDPAPVDMGYILGSARQLRHVRDWFVPLLLRCEARIGLLVDYNLVSMAFAAACREVGIPSVEIQHGVQGELHWAYGRWRSVPPEGYDLLPSVYWTWSEREASVIEEWAADTGGRHRAVVGGNLWLRTWMDGDREIVRRHDRLLRASEGVQTTVLCTLQPAVSDASQLRLLSAAVAGAPRSWRWWFRLHPAMSAQERSRLSALLSGEPRVEVDEISDLPLYALLRAADAHLTRSSSTVLEARAFGVGTVLTDQAATMLFPDEVAAGWAVAAESPDELLEALSRQAARRAAPPPTTQGPRAAGELLRRLLTPAP